jgi:hypothetical protein
VRPTRGVIAALIALALPMGFICKATNPVASDDSSSTSSSGSGSGSGTAGPSASLKAVQDYAKTCMAAIHLDPAKDLLGPYECQGGSAHRLELRVGGKSMDIGICTGSSCPKEGDEPLSKCDYPTWLDQKCYGNSYVQEIPTSNKVVKAVLLCRHKHNLSNKPDTFGDIAMIAHNRGNGETCWFQAESRRDLGGGRREGNLPGNGRVYGPLSSQVIDGFWFDPVDTKNVYCVKCHDNGPWMNSRWMRNTIDLEDGSSGPYKNSTPPFGPPYTESTPVANRTTWLQPTFIELDVKKDDLADNQRPCTDCHRIAAGVVNADPDPNALGGRDFNSCKVWIKRTTGTPFTHTVTGADLVTDFGKAEDIRYWMPDGDSGGLKPDGHPNTGQDAKSFEATYRKHVDKVLKCCEAMGKLKSIPKISATLPDGCREMKPTPHCSVDQPDGSCPFPLGS